MNDSFFLKIGGLPETLSYWVPLLAAKTRGVLRTGRVSNPLRPLSGIAGTAPICYDFCPCDSLLFTSFLNLVQKNLRGRRKFPVFFPGKVNLTVNGSPQRSFCKRVR